MRQRSLLLGLVALSLAACSGVDSSTSSPSSDAPAQAVLRYLEAKVSGSREGVREYLCSALEDTLDREALSFSGVEARLNNASCATDEGGGTVTCTGEISAVYGTETRSIPLTRYNVVQEDGQWRWCGEATTP